MQYMSLISTAFRQTTEQNWSILHMLPLIQYNSIKSLGKITNKPGLSK